MGFLEDAVAGRITAEMKIVAEEEKKTLEFICRGMANA